MFRLPVRTVCPPKAFNSRSKKSFHLPRFSASKYFFYLGGFQGLTKRNNIYHFKAPVWIVINDSVSLNYVSFYIPEEGEKKFVYFFNSLCI